MPEVLLDELEALASIEQMGGDRVPERVAGRVFGKPGCGAVAFEQRLNLALLEWPRSTREERCAGIARRHAREMLAKQGDRAGEKRLLAPATALESTNDDPAAGQADVAPCKESDLPDPKAMMVDQGEQCSVPEGIDDREESAEVVLGQVARRSLARGEAGGHGEADEAGGVIPTARFSRKVQCSEWSSRRPVNRGCVRGGGPSKRAQRPGGGRPVFAVDAVSLEVTGQVHASAERRGQRLGTKIFLSRWLVKATLQEYCHVPLPSPTSRRPLAKRKEPHRCN
jgi:hypothetical protein